MPESRPLSSLRHYNFDDPPASSDATSPYPDRHSSLRRALQSTSDLARDASRNRDSAFSPAIDSPRNTSMSSLRRMRRRLRNSSRQEEEVGNEQADEAPERRSAKRRKLNVDSPPASKGPIKYGRYGQIEPGRLRMEIISNDGGEHKDPRNPSMFLGAKNILKLDKSVYCSERTSAGIVLRHADKTPFCLEKLHIVGPEHGFTAPVREGLVYVAMDMKDLQSYLDPPFFARRSGVHEPPYQFNQRRYRNLRASPERLTLSDALRDPEIATAANRAFSPLPQERDDTPDEEPYYGAEYLRQTDPEAHCDIPSPPAEPVHSSVSNGIPFTLLSDEESGPEESSPQEVLDYRLQRLRRMPPRNQDSLRFDDWTAENGTGSSEFDFDDDQANSAWQLPRNNLEELLSRARGSAIDAPYSITFGGSAQAEGLSRPRGAPCPGMDDPNVTTARFYVKRGKSRVAIKFDPPVSGRYILLKLWAGRTNVDVQSVVAKGFAGPRFFPAMELR